MSRLYKCDFCEKTYEYTDEIYQLESVPGETRIYQDVYGYIGKHICRDCLKSMKGNVIRVVPGKQSAKNTTPYMEQYCNYIYGGAYMLLGILLLVAGVYILAKCDSNNSNGGNNNK